jgi:hypothetical protein
VAGSAQFTSKVPALVNTALLFGPSLFWICNASRATERLSSNAWSRIAAWKLRRSTSNAGRASNAHADVTASLISWQRPMRSTSTLPHQPAIPMGAYCAKSIFEPRDELRERQLYLRAPSSTTIAKQRTQCGHCSLLREFKLPSARRVFERTESVVLIPRPEDVATPVLIEHIPSYVHAICSVIVYLPSA